MNEEMRKAVDALYFGKTDLPPEEQMKNLGGILSILAPDPDDPLEYLGAVGLPVFIVKRLNRLKQIAGDPKAADEVRDIANDIVQSADADQLRLVQRELDEIETMGSNKVARDSDPDMPITARYTEGSNIMMNVGRAKRIVNDGLKDQGPSMEEKRRILARMRDKPSDAEEITRLEKVLLDTKYSNLTQPYTRAELDTLKKQMVGQDNDTSAYLEFLNEMGGVREKDFEYIEKAQKLGLPEEKLSDLLTKSDREINEVLNKLVKDKPKGMKAGGMVMNYGDYGRTYK